MHLTFDRSSMSKCVRYTRLGEMLRALMAWAMSVADRTPGSGSNWARIGYAIGKVKLRIRLGVIDCNVFLLTMVSGHVGAVDRNKVMAMGR